MLYGVKVNISGQCMADAFVGVMPDLLTHCTHCRPLTGLKQFYTRSVMAESAEEYFKSFKKYIKKIKITLSLRCLTLFVCSHRKPQAGLCYCQGTDRHLAQHTPNLLPAPSLVWKLFASSLKFQASTVSADFSFMIILLPLLYFFYLCSLWDLELIR